MSEVLTSQASSSSRSPTPLRREESESAPLEAGSFAGRHLGSNPEEIRQMLSLLGHASFDEMIEAVVPRQIRSSRPLRLPEAKTEHQALSELKAMMQKNRIFRSYLGMGYADCITPAVIQRNILENPGWYTAYTPYQAEIAQGRLEALLNFQTMVKDLTGLEIANASLLDEATAAAEAMVMCRSLKGDPGRNAFFVSEACHPQTIDVVKARAEPLGMEVVVGDHRSVSLDGRFFGILLQYPAGDGAIYDYQAVIEAAHAQGALVAAAADLLSLTLIRPPGEFGADIAVGSSQRFGVPLGYGGPHAAYFATRDIYKRQMPGRLIGVSHDAQGRPALRLALQTREQHIRRDKATSNICTAQALLAVIASMYAVYHGPQGLKRIALRIQRLTAILAEGLQRSGFQVGPSPFFDTLRVELRHGSAPSIARAAESRGINLRVFDDHTMGISLDETTSLRDVEEILSVVCGGERLDFRVEDLSPESMIERTVPFARTSLYLTHPVFQTHHTETEMLRYIRRLESRDLSLTTSMIPLGSCTMKLNATSEMLPVTWPEVGKIHPFAPIEQASGYQTLFQQLEQWLAEITGFDRVSLQPNAGSQGEYAGLLVIRRYHQSRGQGHRNICLIPQSAHGTNPASAAMAGFKVVPVACDKGDIDLADLRARAAEHRENLAALMVTYPSTHGVFEESIKEVCEIIHSQGGQVYMDGANMNAQVGLCRPGEMGADVCHLNLHKTFCIPHGGGGPGVGPIGVALHLAPFLPGHPLMKTGGILGIGAISAAPWGSASILTIPWVYISLMGGVGLSEATRVAILHANYIAKRLDPYFPVLYRGKNGLVAHECILDLRGWKAVGIEVEDVAKRLMDYGFHAPTISWPVPGTMMVEPTESESKEEIDRFCDAMILIHAEIQAIENGVMDRHNNLLKNAPHTAEALLVETWERPYTREQAAFPAPWTRAYKFWPAVGRIDSVYGDRNLICSCPSVEEYGG